MKVKILFVLLVFSLLAKAQTIEVSGLQSGIWDADTIFVMDNVIIEDTLNITAGTTVLFNGFYNIYVKKKATLNAHGTENDSIVFTVDDTTGFYVFDSGRGGWNGIRLEKAGSCQFDYCRFQYSKAAMDDDQDGGALRIFSCNDVTINHSTLSCNFSREHGGALSAENSIVAMNDCDVTNNLTYSKIDTIYYMYGGGLRFLKCEVSITKTNFRNNVGESAIGGAVSIDSCSAHIDRCRFEHNFGINGGGLYLMRCYDNPCSITNSLFAHNTSGHFGGGLAISESSPLVANLTVTDNHSIGVNCGGIFFYQHCSSVLWNCIVYGNTNESTTESPVQMWSWTYDDDAPEFHNCLVQFGLENITSYDRITVYENCLDENPLFVDPENEDYHLAEDSPCINVGSPETPDIILNGSDLDGCERVNSDFIDLGAYESNFTNIQETSPNVNRINVIGNPITHSSYAEIELDHECILKAYLYSLDGRLMVDENLGTFQKGINFIEISGLFQPLSSGIYLLTIQIAGNTYSTKVIKP